MSEPMSSLRAQIAAVERAHDWTVLHNGLTEEQILLEQKYLSDAVKTISWVSTHSDELKEFFTARKASK